MAPKIPSSLPATPRPQGRRYSPTTRKVLLVLFILLAVYISFLFGPFVGLAAILLISVTLAQVLTREERAARRKVERWRLMSLRKFLGLLLLVALVAVLYSPSALQLPVNGGGTSHEDSRTFKSMSPFVGYLRSNYRVVIVNSTQSLLNELDGTGKVVYALIGPDQNHSFTRDEARIISERYRNGSLSLLMAEGNDTNNSFLTSLFQIRVAGDVITDPTSPFLDARVFTAASHLGSGNAIGVFDIASPIILQNQTFVTPFATSSPNSTEISNDFSLKANVTKGPRIVGVSGELNGSRAIIVSDSAPFSTAYNAKFSELGVDEHAFVKSTVEWVTRSDGNATIILDNAHYAVPVINVQGSAGLNLSIARLFALALSSWISGTNEFYTGFLQALGPYAIIAVFFTTSSVYGILTSKYAAESRGKDDDPIPSVEKSIVAESREKTRFLRTTRDREFYVGTLQQLYDVMDSVIVREFGSSASFVGYEDLAQRLGDKGARDATRVLSRLFKLSQYAEGKLRFLLPPVLRWKRTFERLCAETEEILNLLGLTMTGSDDKKLLEYKLWRD